MKTKLDKLTYLILTTQPMLFDKYEVALIKEQIPDYDQCNPVDGLTIMKAQKIVSDYRKTIYECI